MMHPNNASEASEYRELENHIQDLKAEVNPDNDELVASLESILREVQEISTEGRESHCVEKDGVSPLNTLNEMSQKLGEEYAVSVSKVEDSGGAPHIRMWRVHLSFGHATAISDWCRRKKDAKTNAAAKIVCILDGSRKTIEWNHAQRKTWAREAPVILDNDDFKDFSTTELSTIFVGEDRRAFGHRTVYATPEGIVGDFDGKIEREFDAMVDRSAVFGVDLEGTNVRMNSKVPLLVQICGENDHTVWLVRLLDAAFDASEQYPPFLRRLFECSRKTKYVFSSDFLGHRAASVVDVQRLIHKKREWMALLPEVSPKKTSRQLPSLCDAVNVRAFIKFGMRRPILRVVKDKRITMSNWSIHSLTADQVEYAAADAYMTLILGVTHAQGYL